MKRGKVTFNLPAKPSVCDNDLLRKPGGFDMPNPTISPPGRSRGVASSKVMRPTHFRQEPLNVEAVMGQSALEDNEFLPYTHRNEQRPTQRYEAIVVQPDLDDGERVGRKELSQSYTTLPSVNVETDNNVVVRNEHRLPPRASAAEATAGASISLEAIIAKAQRRDTLMFQDRSTVLEQVDQEPLTRPTAVLQRHKLGQVRQPVANTEVVKTTEAVNDFKAKRETRYSEQQQHFQPEVELDQPKPQQLYRAPGNKTRLAVEAELDPTNVNAFTQTQPKRAMVNYQQTSERDYDAGVVTQEQYEDRYTRKSGVKPLARSELPVEDRSELEANELQHTRRSAPEYQSQYQSQVETTHQPVTELDRYQHTRRSAPLEYTNQRNVELLHQADLQPSEVQPRKAPVKSSIQTSQLASVTDLPPTMYAPQPLRAATLTTNRSRTSALDVEEQELRNQQLKAERRRAAARTLLQADLRATSVEQTLTALPPKHRSTQKTVRVTQPQLQTDTTLTPSNIQSAPRRTANRPQLVSHSIDQLVDEALQDLKPVIAKRDSKLPFLAATGDYNQQTLLYDNQLSKRRMASRLALLAETEQQSSCSQQQPEPVILVKPNVQPVALFTAGELPSTSEAEDDDPEVLLRRKAQARLAAQANAEVALETRVPTQYKLHQQRGVATTFTTQAEFNSNETLTPRLRNLADTPTRKGLARLTIEAGEEHEVETRNPVLQLRGKYTPR